MRPPVGSVENWSESARGGTEAGGVRQGTEQTCDCSPHRPWRDALRIERRTPVRLEGPLSIHLSHAVASNRRLRGIRTFISKHAQLLLSTVIESGPPRPGPSCTRGPTGLAQCALDGEVCAEIARRALSTAAMEALSQLIGSSNAAAGSAYHTLDGHHHLLVRNLVHHVGGRCSPPPGLLHAHCSKRLSGACATPRPVTRQAVRTTSAARTPSSRTRATREAQGGFRPAASGSGRRGAAAAVGGKQESGWKTCGKSCALRMYIVKQKGSPDERRPPHPRCPAPCPTGLASRCIPASTPLFRQDSCRRGLKSFARLLLCAHPVGRTGQWNASLLREEAVERQGLRRLTRTGRA